MDIAIREVDRPSAEAVLARVVTARRIQDRAAAEVLAGAAEWADLHPGLDPDWVAPLVPGWSAADCPLAGEGTPAVDERCLAELGAALGRTTQSARLLVADALELRHRLPRLWQNVLECRVAVPTAREVAVSTRTLSPDAVDFVDRQLAGLAVITSGRVVRLVEAAVARYLPDLAEERRLARAERRHVDIGTAGRTDGLADLTGVLDLADAIDLDTVLSDRAAELGRLGVAGSLDVRRSVALGDLARAGQDPLDLSSVDAERVAEPSRRTRGRRVVLYVHLSEAALTGRNDVGWLSSATTGAARLVDTPVLSGQVRDWLRCDGTAVSVRPVIDLNESVAVAGYQVPDRIRERLQLRDQHCVFPWCRNRRTDADHIVPYDSGLDGGPTSTDNLAPLCRQHHRYKTFTRWRYRMIRPGLYLWTSPMGSHYLRDPGGTYLLE